METILSLLVGFTVGNVLGVLNALTARKTHQRAVERELLLLLDSPNFNLVDSSGANVASSHLVAALSAATASKAERSSIRVSRPLMILTCVGFAIAGAVAAYLGVSSNR